MIAHAMGLNVSREDAEDIAQLAILRGLNVKEFEHTGATIGYALRIVQRLVMDHKRNQRRRITAVSIDQALVTEDGEELLPSDVVAWHESEPEEGRADRLRAPLERLLRQLPAKERQALTLSVHGVSCLEGARRMGVPVGSFKSLCHRGRVKLREMAEALPVAA